MGSHVAPGYPWRHTEVETTMRIVLMGCLASTALACVAVRGEASVTGEPSPDYFDGDVNNSICSINDGMGSIGGGSAGTATSDKELIDDAGSGFVGDGGGAFAQGDGSSVG